MALLTSISVKWFRIRVRELQVLTDPVSAAQLMDPMRRRVLAGMLQPTSAAQLAGSLGLTRQKVNYHMRALERCGLTEQIEQRTWGGITERVMVATAASYVVSTEALGELGSDPRGLTDRLSARYLIALAARTVREVATLVRRAELQNKQIATLSLDVDIRFASAEDRAAFVDDLGSAVRSLVARHHSPETPGSRMHRLVVGLHPIPPPAAQTYPMEQPT